MPQVTTKALREQRKKFRDDMSAMVEALNARAETEGPGVAFSAEDQARFDKLESDITALDNRIKINDRTEAFAACIGEPIQAQQAAPVVLAPAGFHPSGATRDVRNDPEVNALAMQAWFAGHSSSHDARARLTSRHHDACEALGVNPHWQGGGPDDDLVIRLATQERFEDAQAAYRDIPRHGAANRARAALNYRAALSSVGAAAGGIIMAPETMIGDLEINLLAYGGMMQVAEIMRTEGRERLRWPTTSNVNNKGVRLEENQPVQTLTATTTPAQPTFGAVYWDVYKYYSGEMLVPYELLNGTPFNLPKILGGMMGESIGRKFADDSTYGMGPAATGGAGPTGIVTAATSYAAPSATAIAWDDLESLIGAVDPAYRTGAAFMFHDATRQYLKKLKDGIGRPLWQDGPNGEEPATIKGYPWYINQSMDSTIASGKKTVLFGQLNKYKVRQVGTIRIYRLTERHRENDQDAFLAFSEMDGNLLQAGTPPVKYLLH